MLSWQLITIFVQFIPNMDPKFEKNKNTANFSMRTNYETLFFVNLNYNLSTTFVVAKRYEIHHKYMLCCIQLGALFTNMD